MTIPPKSEQMDDQQRQQQQLQNQNYSQPQQQDTRTHVVGELYDTERSYVESLQILIEKYMKPLKSYDSNKTLIDSNLVDEIFYTIPELLKHHEHFLSALQDRLSSDWDSSQVIGNVFIEAFTNQQIIDTYTAFINNWKNARQAIKTASQARPAFERFLEAMSREHKNKLTLDALLIMPVQRIPRYELLIKELIKHTPESHPDHKPLIGAQRQIHELALKIDCAEKEMLQQERLRDIEALIEGHIELQHPQRDFIRYDLVTISASTTLTLAKKERVLFLFCDLLMMTSVKKKVSRRSNLQAAFTNSSTDLSLLEGNKFKLLLRSSIDLIEIKQDNETENYLTNSNQHNNDKFHQKQQQQQNQIVSLNNKRSQLEDDLYNLQQIELISSQLNLVERNELTSTLRRLADQVHRDISSIDYQMQQNDSTIDQQTNQRDLYIIGQQNQTMAADQLSNQLQEPNNLLNNQRPSTQSILEQQQQQESKQTFSSSNQIDERSTSIEFIITNLGQIKDGPMNANSSSMNYDSAGESSQQPTNQYSGSGQNIDQDFNNNNTSSHNAINNVASNNRATLNQESLVVTFMSAEKRQAFFQAFMDAKRQRYQQQKQDSRFPNAMILHQQFSLERSPLRASRPLIHANSDCRRTKLRHQDEVDLRHLENMRIEHATKATRNASAPHQTSYSSTIVHQMSAPQPLPSVALDLTSSIVRPAYQSMKHCETCSSGCMLETDNKNRPPANNCQTSHQTHHHHQLIHQPASQPAMLSTICCHDHHMPPEAGGTRTQLLENHSGFINMIDKSSTHSNFNSLDGRQNPDRYDSNQRDTLTLDQLSLRFAPRFMLTLPMAFLNTQHSALQISCSASRKDFPSNLTGRVRSQTVKDDLGQFWLCMSNGFVSHVALVSFKKKTVSSGLHGEAFKQGHGLDRKSQTSLEFQCYDVIPSVRSNGDICKSQINCATHVDWSKSTRKSSSEIKSERDRCAKRKSLRDSSAYPEPTGKDAEEPVVKVAIKSASPPVDIKSRINDLNASRRERRLSKLSESAPLSGLLDAKGELSKTLIPSTSSIQLSATIPCNPNELINETTVTNTTGQQSVARGKSHMDKANRMYIPNTESTKKFVQTKMQINRRPHHHSHEQLTRQHSSKQTQHQRSLSPSCSHNNTYDEHQNHTTSLNQHKSTHVGPFYHHSYHSRHNGNHSHQNNHQHHYHVRHSLGHHTYHSHSHHHHHHHHHHNHHHHNHSQTGGRGQPNSHHTSQAYSSKHNTVPIADLKRALERQNRVVLSDVEGGCAASVPGGFGRRMGYRNQLALPPNNSPYKLEKSSFDSSDGSERRSSPVGSVEPLGSPTENMPTNEVQSVTSHACHSRNGPVSHQKSFQSARVLRHQASLKTSSILAKLVSGASKGSSYLKRKESSRKSRSGPSHHSDLDDIDTDTDTSALAHMPSRKRDQDNSSIDSTNLISSSAIAGGLMVPNSRLTLGRSLDRKHGTNLRNLQNGSMSASMISPLSSVSSLNSTNSSLTVNSACASSHGHGSCAMLHSQLYLQNQPQWSSTGCCANGSIRVDQATLLHDKNIENEPIEPCHMRARSATVPCRAFCDRSSLDHPDSYLLTRCNDSKDFEDGLRQLKDEILNHRPLDGSLGNSYKVSEILKNSADINRSREIYHRGDSIDLMNRYSSNSSRERLDTSDVQDKTTLWLGCEDGSLLVIDCLNSNERNQDTDVGSPDILNESCRNIHCELKLDSAICDIKNYRDQKIFVALANGQLAIFERLSEEVQAVNEPSSVDMEKSSNRTAKTDWQLMSPRVVTICVGENNVASKICIVDANHHLWYAYGRRIYVLDIRTLDLMTTIRTPVIDEPVQLPTQSIHIDHLERADSFEGIWVAFRGNPLIQFYHYNTFRLLIETSLLEPINKVLSFGNEIIRQHKTACLGATSLLSVTDESHNLEDVPRDDENDSVSLFVGTTAGIIIYLSISRKQLNNQIAAEKSVWNPQVISLRHGHSGLVKFLRLLEIESEAEDLIANDDSGGTDGEITDDITVLRQKQLCLISAGAGTDLYGPNNEPQATQQLRGDEDCMSHLILWRL